MAPSYVQAAVSDEQATRERRLNEVRRRLAYRSWLIPQLATVLEWPGGRVGVRAALRELAELGEVEERDGGEWHATPALQVPGRPHRPQRPQPTQAEEADMSSIPEQITALLAERPWLTARQVGDALPKRGEAARVSTSTMARAGRLQRRKNDDGVWVYALPNAAAGDPNGASVEQPASPTEQRAVEREVHRDRVRELEAELEQARAETIAAKGHANRMEAESREQARLRLQAESERDELRRQIEQARLERDNWRTGAEQLAANLETANRTLEQARAETATWKATAAGNGSAYQRLEQELNELRRQDLGEDLKQELLDFVRQVGALAKAPEGAKMSAILDRLRGRRDHAERVEALAQLREGERDEARRRVAELERERDELYTVMGPGPGTTHTQAVDYATQLRELGKRAAERAQEVAALDAADAHRVRELEEQVRRHQAVEQQALALIMEAGIERDDLVDAVSALIEDANSNADEHPDDGEFRRLHGQIAAVLHLLGERERQRRAATLELEQANAVEELAEERGRELAGLTVTLLACVVQAGLTPRSTTPGVLAEQMLRHLREQHAAVKPASRSEAA